APYVAPMQRSMTPNAPGYAPSPGYGQPGYAGGRSPFMSGLLGGLVGAGIGGLLFGHGLFGGFTGFGSFIGFLIQIFLIVWIARWLFRRFRGPAYAGGPGIFARAMPGGMAGGTPVGARAGSVPAAGAPLGPPPGPPVAITTGDYQQFEQSLKAVQDAWSRSDLPALQLLATPEMVSYFAEQLAEFASRGVRNTVSDVRLAQGDLAQSWREGNREYATVAMRFSMIDVTRDGAGNVVDGSPAERQSATEVWTFVRVPGGRWLLSAIQQAR
ncbi:MAG TPA: Tim44-like domain-containing protein, partial [Acidisphaera sp.]|nr:Tim44-like domain-containing protein [Acidisphaera sp.]